MSVASPHSSVISSCCFSAHLLLVVCLLRVSSGTPPVTTIAGLTVTSSSRLMTTTDGTFRGPPTYSTILICCQVILVTLGGTSETNLFSSIVNRELTEAKPCGKAFRCSTVRMIMAPTAGDGLNFRVNLHSLLYTGTRTAVHASPSSPCRPAKRSADGARTLVRPPWHACARSTPTNAQAPRPMNPP